MFCEWSGYADFVGGGVRMFIGILFMTLDALGAPLSRCDEFVNMLKVGIPEGIIVESVLEQGKLFTSEELECLGASRVPNAVLDAAKSKLESGSDRAERWSAERRQLLKEGKIPANEIEQLISKSVEENKSKVGDWRIDVSRSLMDDSFMIVGRVEGKVVSGDAAAFSGVSRPSLYFRCKEGSTDLFVVTGRVADPEIGLYESVTARIRVDKNPPKAVVVSESTDHFALFFPAAMVGDSELMVGRSLLFEYVPFRSVPAIVEFPISGISAVAEVLWYGCPSEKFHRP